MTKYILQGGRMRDYADGGKSLFTEMVDGLGAKPRILMCFFAEPTNTWAAKYDEWTTRVSAAVSPVQPSYTLATVELFEEQAKDNDILFLYGGRNHVMQQSFAAIPYADIIPRFKAVMGSSAGAIFLASDSWSADERTMVKGSGIVAAKTIVHYQSNIYDAEPGGVIDWEAAYSACATFGDSSQPMYALREASHVVA